MTSSMEAHVQIGNVKAEIYDVYSMGRVLDLKFHLSSTGNQTVKTPNENLIIFYLDKSGSMGGSPVELAKEAMLNVMEELKDSHSFVVLPFDHCCSVIDIRGQPLSSKIDLIKRIHGNGGTAFLPTFECTREIVEGFQGQNTELYMIFLTDGQAEGKDYVMNELKSLLDFIQTKTKNAQIHCLGFSSYHDAPLLGEMAKALGSEGTFQYIPDSASIKEKMENLYPLITSSRMRWVLKEQKSEFKAKFVGHEYILDPESDDVTAWPPNSTIHSARIVLPASVPFDGTFEIEAEDENSSSRIAFEPENRSATVEGDFKVNLLFEVISHQLIESINRIMDKDCTKEEGEQIKTEFERANAMLDELRDSASKLKGRARRKEILSKFTEVKSSISSFYGFYRKHLEKSVTNEDVAKMYDIAYRGAIKKGLQKQIDKRAEGNTIKFQDYFAQITKRSQDLNVITLEIRAKYAEFLKKIGVCYVSTFDPIELLEDEDCLAICLNVTRSEAAIADASRVRIRNIFPSKMGAAIFQDTYEFALEERDAIDVNGGFNHRSGAVVKGTAGEEINAVMPLYLFEEHWSIASYWMKMSLGLLTTLDPLGYSFDQLVTIPFLVLDKAYKDLHEKENEHTRFTYELVLDTCVHLFRDISKPNLEQRFNETLKAKLQEYLADPAARSTDVVSSNQVFIAQLFVGQQCGEIAKLSGAEWVAFYQAIIEEECRRSAFSENYSLNVDEMLRLVEEKEADWITQHVESYKHGKLASVKDDLVETARIKFAAQLEVSGGGARAMVESQNEETKPEEVELTCKDPEKWTPKLKGTEKGLVELEGKLQTNLDKFILYNLQMLNGLADPSKEKPLLLRRPFDFGLDTPEKLAAFLVQAASHSKNSDRRESTASGTFTNAFKQEQAVKFLTSSFSNLVSEKKRSLISAVDKELEGNKSAEYAFLFATSEDVEVAAGSIVGAQLGVDVGVFFTAITEGTVPHVEAKLDLLFGHFPGIRTYKDKDGKWLPSRQRCFQIYCKYRKLMPDEKWAELFTKIGSLKAAASIEAWNKRSAHMFKE